ncbi:unnamed protein product [Schistocephalus solidus]|uniref:Secreted protein n=1 Tax=Schistocephalus solidus TaxID=70667 RepID=A0A183S926_SCHSO|nr:unnamed protein product [Schistocephalus solidus]
MCLSRFLSLAQVLLGLIEVGGFALRRLYGRQTDRLLKTVVKVIDNSEVLAYSAPELALVTCIEEGLKSGKFPGVFGELSLVFYIEDTFHEFWVLSRWNLSSALMAFADSEPCASLHAEGNGVGCAA